MHYIKFIKTQTMPMFRHCARENEHYSNENIDRERTHLNYNLGPGGNQWGLMEDRLKQLQYRKQKNNIVLCGWVITSPSNLPPEKQKDFFKIMYDFMAKKYGQENVVSSFVHMDETNPHMHFLYVPGTKDFKLSASKTTNRITLQNIHDEAQKEIDKHLGHEYLMRADNPEDRAKEKSPKVEVFKQALNALESKNEIAQIENDFMNEEIDNQTRIIKKNEQTIKEQQATIQENSKDAQQAQKLAQALPELKQRINNLLKQKKSLENDIEGLNDIKNLQEQKKILENDIKGLNDIQENFMSRMSEIILHGELAQREMQGAILNGRITNEKMEQLKQEIEYGHAASDIMQFLENLEQEYEEPEL